ncbi:zinc finger protein 7-like isoform X2 [Clupea harengus]|uniref:Zinc finger protein 7-like isoform X2 n=1 Tax=Clupea harengus TaxID=7950 RepID=A0A6P8GTF0_CLUHA|nr:zinc finger protein 7-like isoform X2 [Clupea harengus]
MELRFSEAENTERSPLPMASLRLLVPPLRLMAAYLWQVMQRGDAMQYRMLADFVTLVTEAIPELLSPKHAAELILGLQARVVLELCRGDHAVAPDNLQLHLDNIQLLLPVLGAKENSRGGSGADFTALVQTLLTDPEERESFFQHVFPDVCGSHYDKVLQTLMWDFLMRLEKLTPVPDLLQTVSWLDDSAALAADCTECISQPEPLKLLIQHPAALAPLDTHSPPSVLGGTIRSLLLLGPRRPTPATADDPVTSEEVATETLTMTECIEMELGMRLAVGEAKESGGEEASRGGGGGGGGGAQRGEEESRQGGAEEAGVEVTQRGGGEESREGVSEREKTSEDESGKAELPCPQQEAEGQVSSATSCVDGERAAGGAASDSAVPVGWRRSQRKPKKTWKVKTIHLQMQKGKVMTQERKHWHCLESKNINSSKSSDVGPICEKSAEKSADEASLARSCPQCPFSHQQEALVRQHQELAHSDWAGGEQTQTAPPIGPALPHACADCGKSYRFASELKSHRRTHSGERPFECPQCGKSFVHSQALVRHRHTHAAERLYECGKCSETFPSLSARAAHRRTQHDPRRQRCADCGKCYSSASALARHQLLHTEERPYKCPQCPAAFPCLSNLNRHALTHRTERSHRCTCGKAFTYKGALLSHQRVHSSERPYHCGECGKGFLYKGGLEQHRKTHSDEKPFLCSHCGKGFKRQRSLSKHVSGHTREDVFRCTQCDKTFCYKASLTRHELTHSGERPFLCDDCGKGFFSFSELQKHQRFHTGHKPFQCPHCNKSFTQSCYLTLHMRYHTGVKPYTCPSCGKSFSSSTRLKRHLRIHTGEKPYQCSECTKCFQQSYQLKAHRQTHLTLTLDESNSPDPHPGRIKLT